MNRVFLCLLMLLIAPAHADRDIVYAARYYNPPGSRGTSHFHLYRINPNGTGRLQITFGNADDDEPQWSPNGQEILFLRDGANHVSLCTIRAGGGIVHVLASVAYAKGDLYSPAWSPSGNVVSVIDEFTYNQALSQQVLVISIDNGRIRQIPDAQGIVWSPDGTKIYVCGEQKDRILNVASNTITPVTPSIQADFDEQAGTDPLWVSKTSYIASWRPYVTSGASSDLSLLTIKRT